MCFFSPTNHQSPLVSLVLKLGDGLWVYHIWRCGTLVFLFTKHAQFHNPWCLFINHPQYWRLIILGLPRWIWGKHPKNMNKTAQFSSSWNMKTVTYNDVDNFGKPKKLRNGLLWTCLATKGGTGRSNWRWIPNWITRRVDCFRSNVQGLYWTQQPNSPKAESTCVRSRLKRPRRLEL